MRRWSVLALLFLAACSLRVDGDPVEPPVPVDVLDPTTIEPHDPEVDPTERPETYSEVLDRIQASKDWTPADFLDTYRPDFAPALSYSPQDAQFLDLIDRSSFALDEDETNRLAADGFTVTDDQFPSFAYGYETIYLEDLPVFVSADSILFALHRSYDAILLELELTALIPTLSSLLESMRAKLHQGGAIGFPPDVEADVDLYLTVAASLLNEHPAAPVTGARDTEVQELVQKALAAEGSEERVLFGSKRKIDFSQFEPRGHYAGIEELERYFRAMMWLGRIDFRMLEPNDQNELVFRRRQFYDTLAIGELVDETNRDDFLKLNDTIGAFVGEPDGLVVTQVPDLLAALGVESAVATTDLDDHEIAIAIQKHRFGAQRIASHFMVNGIDGTTKPLSHSFGLLSQRYVLDSHVFSNLVWDRVAEGKVKRMMPDPLDVAFSALGNDHAGILLEPQLQEHGYQHDLNAMRLLADGHGDDFWDANLYNRWLSALRALSPTDAVADDASGLPGVARTEAWSRRVLQTQMASWAELRHDTILYAKQSFTGGAACEYPDAYVDPYPEVFEAISDFAAHGRAIVEDVGGSAAQSAYFERLEAAATRLASMAEAQRTGVPHDANDLAWINDSVSLNRNCDDTLLGGEGWYPELFYDGREMDYDPTIADVHTQPTDESGAVVGRVLHVGTGMPRGIVVTVDTCEGPRAYVGIVSTYHEEVTEHFKRLTDEDWAPLVLSGDVDSPDWSTERATGD